MAIPGVKTIIRDRFYTTSRQDTPTGPRIVAIARRTTPNGTDGITDLDLVRASNEKDVIDAFGDSSDLHRAYVELVTAGANRVHLVALPSDTVFNHSLGTVTSSSYVSSNNPSGDVFDDAFAAAEAIGPDIILPWGRGGHPLDWQNPATPSDDPEYGFHADNTTVLANNWAYKCAVKAKEISENINPCMVVMGVKPYLSSSENMTAAEGRDHLALADLPDKNMTIEDPDDDVSQVFSDYGPYLVVIAAEIKTVVPRSAAGLYDFGYSNGAPNLAANLALTPSFSSLYNKPLYNVDLLRYVPGRSIQASLTAKGVNSVVLNFNKLAVYAESITFSANNSDYVRITTKRIVDEATNIVRQVCARFIGEPSNIQNRNAMETAITSGLRGMQILGALLASDFAVSYIPSQNKAVIDLVLTPAFELRNIEVRVAISL
jgi:hypothetical protein